MKHLFLMLVVMCLALPGMAHAEGDAPADTKQQEEKAEVQLPPMPDHVVRILKMVPIKPGKEGWTIEKAVAANKWLKEKVPGQRINFTGRVEKKMPATDIDGKRVVPIKLVSAGDTGIHSVQVWIAVSPADAEHISVEQVLPVSGRVDRFQIEHKTSEDIYTVAVRLDETGPPAKAKK